MPTPAPKTEEAAYIEFDGERYEVSDLTFREQREQRKLVRELLGDEHADIGEDAMMCDVLPVFAYLIIRRHREDFTLEMALDLKQSDLVDPSAQDEDEDAEGNAAAAEDGGEE